jgi:hypothetical protein
MPIWKELISHHDGIEKEVFHFERHGKKFNSVGSDRHRFDDGLQ